MIPRPQTDPSPISARPGEITTVDGVIQLVRSWIETAQLKEGDRLPTERALADQFNLNRNLVRRAFMQLDRMGLINRHVGRGTFVGAAHRPTPPRTDTLRPNDYSPAAVLQTRLMIEPRIAALAVANATMADLRALDALIEEAATVEARQRLEALDIAFYQALAAASHNALIAAIAGEIAGARGAVALAPSDTLTMPPEDRAAALEEFRAIVATVRARDPAAAAQAVRRALIRSTRAFSMLARMELLPDEED